MYKLSFSIALVLLSFVGLYGQSQKASVLVSEAYSLSQDFQKVDLFSLSNDKKAIDLPDVIENTEYSILDINEVSIANIQKSMQEHISLDLPMSNQEKITVDLVQVNLGLPSYVFLAPFKDRVHVENGLHYRGIVAGKENTAVAISIFDNEIMGVVTGLDSEDNIVIGQLSDPNKSGNQKHIIYRDKELIKDQGISCSTPDGVEVYEASELKEGVQNRALSDCVRLYFEIDYDIYQDKGGTSGTTNYITGLFNQVATMYANESINVVMSPLVIWSQASPYSGSSSSTLLNQFTANRQGFDGDLAMLLSYQASGGIAYVNGLCSSNPDYSMSFSSIGSSYNTVPTYSWSVMVVTHEFGHLFGSQHTHACAWNGNGTAIDGCYTPEGGCAQPSIPQGGGTVMSYCHLTSAGINLNNGFGTQPGNLIRSRVTNASCLTACGGGGGGGGGTTCTDNELVVTINTDNYPGETTWTVKDASGQTLYSGGPYSSSNSSFTTDMCLPDGCYDFTINDSYGDGICCSYGNGSYAVTNAAGDVLTSGGQYTSVEISNFCTPNNGGGNGGGGGNGPDCIAINFNDYPPVSYGGGQDQGSATVLGNGNILQLDNNAWKAINLDYTVTANTVISFDFGSYTEGEIHGIGFDNNSSISSNRTFKLFGTQNWGLNSYDNYNNVGNWTSYTIPVGQFYQGDFTKFFFVMDHDSNPGNGDSYFSNIEIYEGNSCSLRTSWGGASLAPQELMSNENDFTVYPNPAYDVVNVLYESVKEQEINIRVIDITGRLAFQETVSVSVGSNILPVSLDAVESGSYIISVLDSSKNSKTQRLQVIK